MSDGEEPGLREPEEPKPGQRYYRWLATRRIEEALEEARPAADWLMRHPPGSRLPDELEPGYEPDEYEPETDGVDSCDD